MPRRTSKLATSTPTSAKSHKRQLSSSTASAIVTPGTRASKRLKESADHTPTVSKISPKKSKYFEGSDDEEVADPTSEDVSESGYEDENASATEPSPSVAESEDETDPEEDIRTKKQRRRKPNSSKVASGAVIRAGEGTNELWRQGVKTGLGPGKQVFIEKPKPRGDGGIKYVPDRIHPNTMAFLSDLAKNNDREWLKSRSPLFPFQLRRKSFAHS